MDQIAAFKDTLTFAQEAGMADCSFENKDVDYWHIQEMLEHIRDEPQRFGEAKLGRWLGWAQACVVAGGYGTLNDMKRINEINS